MSLELADGFLTTGPPGKSSFSFLGWPLQAGKFRALCHLPSPLHFISVVILEYQRGFTLPIQGNKVKSEFKKLFQNHIAKVRQDQASNLSICIC